MVFDGLMPSLNPPPYKWPVPFDRPCPNNRPPRGGPDERPVTDQGGHLDGGGLRDKSNRAKYAWKRAVFGEVALNEQLTPSQ